MILENFNIISIVFAAIFSMILGAFWYSSWVCGKIWLKELKLTEDDLKGTVKGYFLFFFSVLVTAFVLAYLIEHTHSNTPYQGAKIGFFVWLGFVATTHFGGVIFAKNTYRLFLVNAVFDLISLCAMGAIIGFFR